MKPRDIPNLITLLRILLVAPVLWSLLQERYGIALALFLLAGVSDGIDGYLAKRYGWTSWLGGLLDPLADKLLLVTTVLILGWQGALPAWLVALVILRDVVIIGGGLAYHYLIEPFAATPLVISKLNTFLQITLVLTVLFSQGAMTLPTPVLTSLIYLTALTTLTSGAAYVWQWGKRAFGKERSMDVP